MSPLKRFLLMLGLTAMWSPSFLFIKLAIHDLPPITVAASRIGLAALVFYAVIFWKGLRLPRKPIFWLHALIMGLFSTAFPFCLFCYAEQTIDSSLAAIVNGAGPMFTAILAHFLIPSDRLSIQKIVGILLCASGLIYLFAPELKEGLQGTVIGMQAAAGAALCYSISHVYGKKYITGYPPFVAPTAGLTMSALFLWPIAFFIESPMMIPAPSFCAVCGVCGLSLFGTVFALIIYYKLLEESGPTAISLVACFFPVGGMLLGMIFLGEVLTFAHLVAAAMILAGMSIVNGVVRLKFLEPKEIGNDKLTNDL